MTLDCARDTGGVHLSRYRKRGHNRTPSRDADLFVRDEEFDFHFCVQVADPISREGRPPCSCHPEFLVFSASLFAGQVLAAGLLAFSFICLFVCGGRGRGQGGGQGGKGTRGKG